MSRMRREVDPALAGVVLCCALYVGWALIFIWDTSFTAVDGERHFCLFDDAMISMRYATNLVQGNGLVWNPEEHVEGITNLGMTLFMVPFIAAFGLTGAVPAVQLSGILFVIWVAVCTLQIGRIVAARSGLAPSAVLSTAFFAAGLLFYPLSYWSLMGMETGLLASLLLGALWIVLRTDDTARPVWPLPVLFGLAFVTRPDAGLPVALMIGYRFLCIRRSPGGVRSVTAESTLFGLFVAATTVFRFVYYGSPVPNTYLLKLTGAPLCDRLRLGAEFVEPLAQSLAIPLAIAAIAAVAGARRELTLLMTLVVASIGYQIAIGGDAWPYWRHSAPFVPLAFVAAMIATVLLVRAGRSATTVSTTAPGRDRRLAVAAAVVVLVVAAERANDPFEAEYRFQQNPYQVGANKLNVDTAIVLREVLTANASVGVFWAGSIPYYTGLRAVDMLGRCDPAIARLPVQTKAEDRNLGAGRLPGHNKFNLEYSVKELQPTYLQYASWGGQSLEEWAKDHYVTVWHRGVQLRLRRDDATVRWDLFKR